MSQTMQPEPGEEVDELRPDMTGQWIVHTLTGRHLWNLDAHTYTRLAGEPGRKDSRLLDLTPGQVLRWPYVGGHFMILLHDVADDPMVSTMRTSGSITAITQHR